MGMACTRVLERVQAAVGRLDYAPTKFEAGQDVVNGGVLWALPALLANGLLRHAKSFFRLPKGFYSLVQILLLLAYMALMRVRNPEQLRYYPAGEGGKLLGLDRVPEARTLRAKIKTLAVPENVDNWSRELSRDWMRADPKSAGVLYVDGHIRVYHGHQTKLPKRFVSREKLCLRGTTDWWVNDQQGRPFFVVSTPFTDGMLNILKNQIVGRLLEDIPGQPSQSELKSNRYLSRFTIIFDREGYSPEFFHQMWHKRIACQTYRKYPKEDWPQSEFRQCSVTMPYHNNVQMQLAERGVLLSKKIWVREIRKLTETGHQTSIISTDYTSETAVIAGHMFSRWYQEHFFKYMMEHYDIDRLIDYQTEEIDETKKVVNPAYRELEGRIRSKRGQLTRKQAIFGQATLDEKLRSHDIAQYQQQKGELKEQIEFLESDLENLKQRRKKTSKHIEIGQLPEKERFRKLAPARKQFIDTIRMIAYRAETAMSIILRDTLARSDDARSLIREIFTTPADIIPDFENATLTIAIHHLSNNLSDNAARHLAGHLNAFRVTYPGTNLRLIYKLVSDKTPPDQEF